MSRKKIKLYPIKTGNSAEWSPEDGIRMRHILLSQKDGLTVLYTVRKAIERLMSDPCTRALKCGCSENCLMCEQLHWCITSDAEKELLGIK